jgi:hypothetical protein
MCDKSPSYSGTEDGAPEVGGAGGVADDEKEERDTPAAAAVVGGGEEEEAGEEDNPFKDSDEEEASPPTKKQKLLDEGTYIPYSRKFSFFFFADKRLSAKIRPVNKYDCTV